VDRVPDSDSGSQGFDSLHAYEKNFQGADLVSTFENIQNMMQVEVGILRKNPPINNKC
jgi:hypothetical protein